MPAGLFITLLVAGQAGAADPTPEHWHSLAKLIGTWSGTSAGLVVEASVQRPLHELHMESFVNTYRRVELPADSTAAPVFECESFEYFNNAWKARESFEFPSDDEFVEVFELAPPGQPWRIYSRTRLKRTSR